MEKVESIKRKIEQLSDDELAAFRSWFAEFDAVAWDVQFKHDVASGKLDKFADEVMRHS